MCVLVEPREQAFWRRHSHVSHTPAWHSQAHFVLYTTLYKCSDAVVILKTSKQQGNSHCIQFALLAASHKIPPPQRKKKAPKIPPKLKGFRTIMGLLTIFDKYYLAEGLWTPTQAILLPIVWHPLSVDIYVSWAIPIHRGNIAMYIWRQI